MQFHESSQVIPQENQGAPVARNNGLKHVGASRVIFLDVDDFFLAGFVDFMAANAENGTDVIAGNYCYTLEQTLTQSILPDEIDIPTAILQGQFTIPGAIAVKTEVARSHLWNTELSADQDGEWTGRLLLSGHSITFHQEVSLAYSLENTNSISRKASRKSVESRAHVCEILLEKLNNSDSIPEDTKSTYRNFLAQRLDSIAFNQFHVDPTICKGLYRRAKEISPKYTPLYNGKSGLLRKLLGFHITSRTLMLARR
jgi:glycosyltransferase involved in cell wall biosynthesis